MEYREDDLRAVASHPEMHGGEIQNIVYGDNINMSSGYYPEIKSLWEDLCITLQEWMD